MSSAINSLKMSIFGPLFSLSASVCLYGDMCAMVMFCGRWLDVSCDDVDECVVCVMRCDIVDEMVMRFIDSLFVCVCVSINSVEDRVEIVAPMQRNHHR